MRGDVKLPSPFQHLLVGHCVGLHHLGGVGGGSTAYAAQAPDVFSLQPLDQTLSEPRSPDPVQHAAEHTGMIDTQLNSGRGGLLKVPPQKVELPEGLLRLCGGTQA
eukprot:3823083-Alexandrium_andersonii.AAC.1